VWNSGRFHSAHDLKEGKRVVRGVRGKYENDTCAAASGTAAIPTAIRVEKKGWGREGKQLGIRHATGSRTGYCQGKQFLKETSTGKRGKGPGQGKRGEFPGIPIRAIKNPGSRLSGTDHTKRKKRNAKKEKRGAGGSLEDQLS